MLRGELKILQKFTLRANKHSIRVTEKRKNSTIGKFQARVTSRYLKKNEDPSSNIWSNYPAILNLRI